MIRGTIIKGVSGLYFVSTEDGVYECNARGLFRKHGISPLIGDRVDILVVEDEKKTGYLQDILTRKNELIRPKVANVDLAVIVFATVNPAINLDLLDGFLIHAAMQNVGAVVCINKTDLADNAAYAEIKKCYEPAGYGVICVSALKHNGMDQLYAALSGKTSILAGPSGVGKTSLINALRPELERETGELSQRLQRGRHTTRHAELLRLDKDTFIADSPGFTSLDISGIPVNELKNYYPDFKKYDSGCFYGDCIHVTEHDCAVKARVGADIEEGRYNRYVNRIRRLL